ncbi:molybdenum ABC transporter substrate-binding protein [Paraburkholderia monticola]|uniref:Molybdenum ABC transporter substrate-binding protein n=1 Tax=Paraburkholderia monticola TaxID=1399968 RepID=A0A149PKI5_9BURK|nr:substrate-binding domain-containing protein [Paraburkholderia monticola]KXU85563.1 molybdenum ABC transporter substrate-binding protein [Paraburkholderia monticola]
MMSTLRSPDIEITGISSMATRHVLNELALRYRTLTGQKVLTESVGGVEAARRLEGGESFDFAVLAKDTMLRLAQSGYVDASTLVDVAQSGIAIAVASGSQCPEVGSEESVRRAIQHARAIGYSTGPSGAHLMALLKRWGIADEVAPRLVQTPPGVPVAKLVASGEVELGIQQLSELVNVEGITIAGELPVSIQRQTVFSGGACTRSWHRSAVLEWLSALRSVDFDEVKERHGMTSVGSVRG